MPRAFGCGPQTVDSFAVWETATGGDPAGPMQSRAQGLGAVPIWFVHSEDLATAHDDGVLTMAELEALDPLVGTAEAYTEVLHPRGAVKNPLLIVEARGILDDGRTFALHITSKPGNRLFNVTFED